MSKELAYRLEELKWWLFDSYTVLDSKHVRNTFDEAIAALRSEPVAWVPSWDFVIAALEKEFKRTQKCGEMFPQVADEHAADAKAFPRILGMCKWAKDHNMPLPAAPSREDRTDRQEPGLSAEQIKRLAPSVGEVEIGARLVIDAGYLDALCDMALRSLTARSETEEEKAARIERWAAWGDRQRRAAQPPKEPK